jgi:HSP20 family protein
MERFASRAADWSPALLSRQFDPFIRMQADMMHWFGDMWRESASAWAPFQRFGAMSAAPLLGLPASDVKETDDAYLLSVELPGMKRDDVALGVNGEVLTITGQKREERHEAAAAYRLNERRYGRFERSFPLPPDVKPDAISAGFADGVLTVTLPRQGQSKPAKRSQVEIKS